MITGFRYGAAVIIVRTRNVDNYSLGRVAIGATGVLLGRDYAGNYRVSVDSDGTAWTLEPDQLIYAETAK